MKKGLVKKIGLTILVLALLFAVYVFFFANNETEGPPLSERQVLELDQEIVQLLLTLQSINLDGAFLDSPLLVNLRDFRVTLTPQPVGRTNPFATVGTDASFRGAQGTSLFGGINFDDLEEDDVDDEEEIATSSVSTSSAESSGGESE